MHQNNVFLSIGTNIGDKLLNLKKALVSLNTNHTLVELKSNFYESEPLYLKNQPNFINMVVKVETSLKLKDFFIFIKNIESEMGRKFNEKKNGPRIIDIDILAYDNLMHNSEELTVPHKKINERLFVLLPWSEIAPDYILPNLKIKIKSLLNTTKDDSKVIKLN